MDVISIDGTGTVRVCFGMFQIAFYGKGGIGKSTVSANVSVSLAEHGYKVMQIGCDPKHDSTRLLLGGRSQRTVLEYVRDVRIPDRKLDDVVERGTSGVLCTEAGGPEPGIGCAGRGILTTFDTLKKLGADTLNPDFKVYDVLGDVVCGGFAVPLRSEYADAVILVTSGEFMAMYAANNIMKGMRNFDSGKKRLLGIVLNSRGVKDEEKTVSAFAEAAGTRIIAVIPRDGLFADAESKGHTVRELYPDSMISKSIDTITDAIVKAVADGDGLVDSDPLDDGQLADLAAGRPIRPHGDIVIKRSDTVCHGCSGIRKSIRDSRPMNSCAAYGAMSAFSRINDIAVVIHGPRSCMYLMDTTRAKAVLELYQRGIYRTKPRHNLRCTMMDDTASIFGGTSDLEKTLESVSEEGFSEVAVITTCMPGIIGDDCRGVIDRLSSRFPDVKYHLVQTDGDIAGEYNDGFDMAVEEILGMVDMTVEPDPNYVNIVGSSFFDLSNKKQIEEVERILSVFGLKVNCRFLDECNSETVRMLRRGIADIPVSDTANCRSMVKAVSSFLGREPFGYPIPFGKHEHMIWLDALGNLTGRTEDSEREKKAVLEKYNSFMAVHRGKFEGKKVMVVCGMAHNVDWIIDILTDLGADLVRVGFITSRRKRPTAPVSRYGDIIVADYGEEEFENDLMKFDPDMLIGDLPRFSQGKYRFARITKIGFGVDASISFATYLENMMRLPDREGWKEGLDI